MPTPQLPLPLRFGMGGAIPLLRLCSCVAWIGKLLPYYRTWGAIAYAELTLLTKLLANIDLLLHYMKFILPLFAITQQRVYTVA